jgi:hypothetical protein
MKVVKQTPTILVVKAGAKTSLLIWGAIILLAGILAIALIRVDPLTYIDAHAPALIRASQETDPSDSQLRAPSTGYAGLNLAHYVGELLFAKTRPFVALGILGVIVGLFIVLTPHHNRSVVLNKAAQQVILKQPKWFFRSKAERCSFQDVSEVRVERDRETAGRSEKNYRVALVISHSEGAPLSRNYIHYKTVFPLSETYRYDYKSAREVVDRIHTFLHA